MHRLAESVRLHFHPAIGDEAHADEELGIKTRTFVHAFRPSGSSKLGNKLNGYEFPVFCPRVHRMVQEYDTEM